MDGAGFEFNISPAAASRAAAQQEVHVYTPDNLSQLRIVSGPPPRTAFEPFCFIVSTERQLMLAGLTLFGRVSCCGTAGGNNTLYIAAA